MKIRTALALCLVTALLISIPSILKIPVSLQFLDADVRSASPKALTMLREKGLWLVNVTLTDIKKENENICFYWSHIYRGKGSPQKQESLTTCIDA